MGCEWIGEYGKVEKHLDFDNEMGECQFVAVKCPLSKQCECTIQRKLLAAHCKKACRYRPYSCKYCGFQSTYVEVTTQHNSECVNYPLLCPNHCLRMSYPRCQLKDHIAKCPDETVACTFSEMGCKELIKRRLLHRHLENYVIHHQTVMCQTFSKQIKSLVDDKQSLVHDKEILEKKLESQNVTIQALEEKVSHLSREIESLKVGSKNSPKDELNASGGEDCNIKALRDIAKKLQGTNWPLYLSKMVEISAIQPFVPIVFNISFIITKEYHASWSRGTSDKCRHYSSPLYYCSPFYSCSNGYKLQLSAKVKCHCRDCSDKKICKDSNKDKLSLSIDVHVVEGEYNSQLKWPFNRTVSITLLNEEANDSHHTISQKCYCRDPTNLRAAVPHGEAPQQPDEPPYLKVLRWVDPYQAQKLQDNLCKHRDFMIFPLNIKGNFLLHQPKPPVYQGNYIGEHQNYVYIQVKL